MKTAEQPSTVGTGSEPAVPPDREMARKRVQAKRDFASHLVAYVVINAFFIGVWAITGGGYFWPAWVLACWGAGLVLHAWDVYWRRPITESDVDTELRRHGG
jgi:hypothetical protein